MANTAITLDVVRTEMTEARFTLHRRASDITSPAQKNNVFQWPGTGTYTLQPLNFTTDFTETNHWEPLKYRMADVNTNPDWFKEVPDNTTKGIGPCDYFFHGVVKAANFTAQDIYQMDRFTNVYGAVVVDKLNYEQQHGVSAMNSKQDQPANQGYCLRFKMEGREAATRAGILDFIFGNFVLRLDSSGRAQLWQSTDFVNYAYVYSWQWSNANQIHGRTHQIFIYPHARNKIEFIASTGTREVLSLGHWHLRLNGQGQKGNGLYEIPGELTFQKDGRTPEITKAGKWGMRVSREFRPAFQVSKIGFANGTNPEAFFWDTITDLTSKTGVVYPPTIPLYASAEFDANGGRVQWGLRNADTGEVFKSDGKSSKLQFAFGMHGLGDLPGQGLGSTISPEFFGYAIDKPPAFFTYERQPYTCPLSVIKIDHGDSAESERMSLTTYDLGAYARFSERGDIPVIVGDLDSGLVFFEGTVHQNEASECPPQTPNGMHMEARGIVDNLLRMHWAPATPNFSADPYDSEHRPYLFGEVIRVCFEASGEPRENVVIEEEERWLKDFRLWQKEESAKVGSGHKSGVTKGAIWQPTAGHPVHEFTDFVIRDLLGWNWVRDKSDLRWHIYKRPDPQVATDVPKLDPKVEFYSDKYPRTNLDIPGYKHSDLKKRLKRPICTTIICVSLMDKTGIANATELSDALSEAADPETENPVDSQFQGGGKCNYQTLTNYYGYLNARNPNPNINNPDFLGRQRIRVHGVPFAENNEGLAWICRRYFEDNCFGYLYRTFEADWGDEWTYNLRKWDVVLVNGEKHYIDRVEPTWSDKKLRRAHYTVTKYRAEVRPPR